MLEADQERLQLLAEEKELKKLSTENSDEGFKANERLMEVYKRLKEINAFSAEGRYVMTRVSWVTFKLTSIVAQCLGYFVWFAIHRRDEEDAHQEI